MNSKWARFAFLLPVAAVASLPTLLYYAATGMEALGFILLLVMVVAWAARALPEWVVFPLVVVMPWMRPEAPVLLLTLLLCLGCFRGVSRQTILLGMRAGLWFAFSFALLLWLRWSLFAELLPNTYYAKTPFWQIGISSLYGYMNTGPNLWLLLCTILALLLGNMRIRFLVMCGLLWAAVFVFEGGDWMPLGRLLLPAMLFWGLAAGLLPFNLCPRLVEILTSRVKIVKPAAWLLIMVAWAGLLIGALPTIKHWSKIGYASIMTIRADEHVLLSLLRQANATSLALVDIGTIGFFSDLEIIDLAGLTDPVISRAMGPLLQKYYDPSYVLVERAPDAIVVRVSKSPPITESKQIVTIPPEILMSRVEYQLFLHDDFDSLYRFGFAILPSYGREPYYGLVVFVRADQLAHWQELGINRVFYAQMPTPTSVPRVE